MKTDRWQTVAAFIIICLPILAFIRSDYLIFGFSPFFLNLLLMRTMALGLISFIILFITKTSDYRRHDYLVLLFLFFLSLLFFFISLTRLEEFYSHAMLEPVAILSLYLLVPNRFVFQLSAGLFYTVLNFIGLVLFKENLTPVISTVYCLSCFFANLVGSWVSWHLHVYRRRQFKTYSKLQQSNDELRQTLEENKMLRGILPVCAYCKKISDSDGTWENMDTYIQKHTEADVSHGICPDCLGKLYKEIA